MPGSFTWRAPTRVVFGSGRVDVLGQEVAAAGSRALLVTDAALAANPAVGGRALAALKAAGVETAVFDELGAEPTEAVVLAGVAAARAARPDVVVALGGGSAIDTAKMVALVLALGGSPLDHVRAAPAEPELLPLVAVPTTAGTGAETSIGAVVTNPATGRKTVLAHWAYLPRVAILDPELTTGLPPSLTAATGMDAYAHAIDVLHSSRPNPFNDALAFHTVRTVHTQLRRAVSDPGDIAARGEMLATACSMGFALSTSPYGIIHALGHSLGARHHLHHGRCVALLTPHGMRWNLTICGARYAETARRAGLAAWTDSDAAAADALIDATEALLQALGLPRRLAEVGVSAGDLGVMAEDAMQDIGAAFNARRPESAAELESLYSLAL